MPNHPVRLGLMAAVGLIAVSLGLLLAGGTLPRTEAQAIPRPPAAPTPARAPTPTRAPTPVPGSLPATPSAEPPGAGRPAYLAAGPSFAGAVLHWTETQLTVTPNGPDPANGDVVTADLWLQLDEAGRPAHFRGTYTHADGTFHQEILQDGEAMTGIFGPGYPSYPPTGCVAPGAAPPGRQLAQPLFAADAAPLAQLGFSPAGWLSQPPPATPPLPGVQPRQTYPVGGAVQGWERRETTANGATVVRRLEVDELDRVIVADGRSLDGSGVVRGASRQVAGLLAVFVPGAVPASIFARSQPALLGCRD